MVIKVYVSLISCSQEVKKNQQRALMILESKNIPYTAIDITDPGQEDAKEYMTQNATPRGQAKVPLTPQIFNEAEYCGDFEDLDMSNENDMLGEFLKLTEDEKKTIKVGITGILPEERVKSKDVAGQPDKLTNGMAGSREGSAEVAKPAAPTTENINTAADSSGMNAEAEGSPAEDIAAHDDDSAVTEEVAKEEAPAEVETEVPTEVETETPFNAVAHEVDVTTEEEPAVESETVSEPPASETIPAESEDVTEEATTDLAAAEEGEA